MNGKAITSWDVSLPSKRTNDTPREYYLKGLTEASNWIRVAKKIKLNFFEKKNKSNRAHNFEKYLLFPFVKCIDSILEIARILPPPYNKRLTAVNPRIRRHVEKTRNFPAPLQ
ncbi:hypothetical protein EGR_04480 [Echinococcus granulosus]|uniref:Uncharacterized protein n=1 Tax=Echinococcus granulosus TaxID=6210 RepID=W6UQQ5_ECHGR|nr:hypothetical protein EGR_04480 [Echinococcus granulosus]EUB60647.1 hypothetical protein EGR_04480 [Echinococcus granulosus]